MYIFNVSFCNVYKFYFCVSKNYCVQNSCVQMNHVQLNYVEYYVYIVLRPSKPFPFVKKKRERAVDKVIEKSRIG